VLCRAGLRRATLAALCVVLLGACGSPATTPTPGVERLGPEQGELIAEYLTRAQGTLPPADRGSVWALVQLSVHIDTASAAALADGTRVSRVVFRVPLPRVQTALVTMQVPGQRPAEELADAQRRAADEREQAGHRARADGQQRLAEIAFAEAAELRAGCACVLALLVLADRGQLDSLTSQSLVRVVHAASPGTPLPSVAVSPLLPEQQGVVGPVPDDGTITGPAPPSATT
jgi:hypothetical protein